MSIYLKNLILSSNEITDLSALVTNFGLGAGDVVWVSDIGLGPGDEIWVFRNTLDLSPNSDACAHIEREDDSDAEPPTISIKLYHFTGLQTAKAVVAPESGDGGGSCFINATIFGNSLIHPAVRPFD